jgi:hypothetical protein
LPNNKNIQTKMFEYLVSSELNNVTIPVYNKNTLCSLAFKYASEEKSRKLLKNSCGTLIDLYF